MDLFESLRTKPNVKYDGERFSFKSKYNVRDQLELVELIRRFVEGIPVADFKNEYPDVMEDLQVLKALGHIRLLRNTDTMREIAYPSYDPPIVPSISVDDELKKLFWSIELPSDMLEKNAAKRRIMDHNGNILNKPEQKKKKIEIRKEETQQC